MRPIFLKIFRTSSQMDEVINDNATNINNIDKYDSENNSMNGESILIDQDFMKKKGGMETT